MIDPNRGHFVSVVFNYCFLQAMDVFSDVTDGLIKQIKNIRNSKSKWIEIVRTTDEIVTSLAYNLMREQKLIISGIRDDSAWSVKEVRFLKCFFKEIPTPSPVPNLWFDIYRSRIHQQQPPSSLAVMLRAHRKSLQRSESNPILIDLKQNSGIFVIA